MLHREDSAEDSYEEVRVKAKQADKLGCLPRGASFGKIKYAELGGCRFFLYGLKCH